MILLQKFVHHCEHVKYCEMSSTFGKGFKTDLSQKLVGIDITD